MEWYVVVDGVQRGPMSKTSVQTLIDKGVLKPETPVRKTTMPNWLAIKHIRDFEIRPVASSAPNPARPQQMASKPVLLPNSQQKPVAPPVPARNSLWSWFARLWRSKK